MTDSDSATVSENLRADHMNVSVIVCTHDRADLLRHCLGSLEGLDYPNFEIVVVDNAPSTDATRRIVEGRRAKYIVEPMPGLGRARNRGIRESSGEIVAFTDDDCRVDEHWLAALVSEFSGDETACVTGAVKPYELRTETQRLLDRSSRLSQQSAGRQVISRANPDWFFSIHSLKAGSGANMAFRRSFLEQHEDFDEAFGRGTLAGGEETHIFFSVLKHDFKLVHTPEAVVYHCWPPEMTYLARRLLEAMTDQTAYLTKLLVCERGYRLQTLRLATRQFRKYLRVVKHEGGQTGGAAQVSIGAELWALARGPWYYLACRRQAAKTLALSQRSEPE